MLTVSRRRPSWSLAWATWTSPWVSTPTVTRIGWACAMVVMAISLRARGWMARAGRVGGQHCDGSVGTGFYQVTLARLAAPGGWPRRRADRSAQGHEAGGPLGSGLPRPPKRSSQWTLARIAAVIERLTGVRYHPGHVWRLLRRLGWSPQRPARVASERDEAEIARWRAQEWPRIKGGR